MRRPPLGPLVPKAHDMTREHRVLDALWPVFPPAPRPFLLCEDPGVIGVPFYVMERRRGVVIRRELPPQWAQDLAVRRLLSETLVDVMVALHAVPFEAVGLGDLGRPEGFMQRQVRGWAERWERARDREVPAITEVAHWLAARVPAPPDATPVPSDLNLHHLILNPAPPPAPPAPPPAHSDLKLDNLMLSARAPSGVEAVLDWELCTTGDPLCD